MNNIEWRKISNYDYAVSNTGQVKRLSSGELLTPYPQTAGYLQVKLSLNGCLKPELVHRLVAEAFIPNDDPKNKVEVNHKDEIKTNNNVNNLEWCTSSYNCSYGSKPKKMRDMKRQGIIAIEEKTKEKEFFPCKAQCVAFLRTSHGVVTEALENNRHLNKEDILVTSKRDDRKWILMYVASEINNEGEETYTSPSERQNRAIIDEINKIHQEMEAESIEMTKEAEANNGYITARLPNLERFNRLKELGAKLMSDGTKDITT